VKSKLVGELHTEPVDPVLDKYIALVDMGFLWHLATPTAEDRDKPDSLIYTWGDYAEKLFATILSHHPKANQIVFVNKPYELEFTTKDTEHDRRQSSQAYSHDKRNL